MWVVFTRSINNTPRHSWDNTSWRRDNTTRGQRSPEGERVCVPTGTTTWYSISTWPGWPAAPLPGGQLYIRIGYRPRAVTHWHLPGLRGGCNSPTLGSRQRVCAGTSRCRESGVAVVMGGELWRERFHPRWTHNREDCDTDTWGTCGVKLTGPHHHLVHLVHLSSPHCYLSTFSQTYVTNQLLLWSLVYS